MSRSPHPRVVARADPHPSTLSPPIDWFYSVCTKRARACVRACVYQGARVLARPRALKGSTYGEDVRAHSRAWTRISLCTRPCACAHAWNRYMPCSVPFFSFTGALSPPFFFLSLSSYLSLSVYACLSFSLLKKWRVRGTRGPLDVPPPSASACIRPLALARMDFVINIRRPNVV